MTSHPAPRCPCPIGEDARVLPYRAWCDAPRPLQLDGRRKTPSETKRRRRGTAIDHPKVRQSQAADTPGRRAAPGGACGDPSCDIALAQAPPPESPHRTGQRGPGAAPPTILAAVLGLTRSPARQRHSRGRQRRRPPRHPVGPVGGLSPPLTNLGIARCHVTPMWLDRGLIPPFFRLAFCQLPPSPGEPALTSKCSPPRLRLPAFPPVSRRKSPPTCLSATDAHPCTRV